VRSWLGVVLCLLALPNASLAADTRFLTQEEMQEWSAAGRLVFNHRTDKHGYGCSATLIAPDLVLTAAHCVQYAFDGAPSKVRQLVFHAGWHTDTSLGTAVAERLQFHPDFDPGGAESFSQKIPKDVALVYLSTPIESVRPIPLGELDDELELLSFVVYQGALSNAPRLASACSHSQLPPSLLQVGCPVVGGNSGGGVVFGNGEDRRLVGVISAASAGRAIAVIPDTWLRDEVAAHIASN